jgi:hypothetical protein
VAEGATLVENSRGELAPDQEALRQIVETNGGAVFRGLDKITARVSEVYAPINAPVRFGSLEVVARFCYRRPPEEPPEKTVFVEIADILPERSRVDFFVGWMFASSPALSALDHPVYDVWLIDCIMIEPAEGDRLADRPAEAGETIGSRDSLQAVGVGETSIGETLPTAEDVGSTEVAVEPLPETLSPTAETSSFPLDGVVEESSGPVSITGEGGAAEVEDEAAPLPLDEAFAPSEPTPYGEGASFDPFGAPAPGSNESIE